MVAERKAARVAVSRAREHAEALCGARARIDADEPLYDELCELRAALRGWIDNALDVDASRAARALQPIQRGLGQFPPIRTAPIG